jgi:hypothetical protein
MRADLNLLRKAARVAANNTYDRLLVLSSPIANKNETMLAIVSQRQNAIQPRGERRRCNLPRNSTLLGFMRASGLSSAMNRLYFDGFGR